MVRPRLVLPLTGSLLLSLVSEAPLAALAPPETTAAALPPQALPVPVRVASVEGLTEYRLGNGLRVVLFPDQSKANITVNVTYLVGSRMESYGETGMAHLLEHLLFKGTDRHPDVPKVLNGLGARFNGSTSYDRTNYTVTFPATADNLEVALALESDRMVNSHIWRKDLDSEMTVVRNEFEDGENSPERVTLERTISAAYNWHNYGRSTIGCRADIENVDIEHLQAFYRTYYQPDNAVLLVSGKFDEATLLLQINQHFGVLPRPTRTLPKTYTLDATQDGERSVTVRRAGDLQLALALYHIPAGYHPDFAALEVLAQIMADTPSGRLHQALVDTRKATAVFPYTAGNREPGFMLFGAQLAKDADLEEAKGILLKVLEQAGTVTQEETDRAKQQLLKGVELLLNQNDHLGVALSEYIAQGDWRLFFLQRDQIQAVTAADVQRVCRAYCKPTNRTLGLFIPTAVIDRSVIPAAPDPEALLKGYQGRAAVAEGEAFEATPANIERRTQRFATPAGLKVAMVAKKTRGETVTGRLVLRLGDLKSLTGQGALPELTGAMLLRGTRSKTRQQLQDAFDGLKAQVQVSGGTDRFTASLTTTRANLPAVLKLLAEVLREPAFPAEELGRLVEESVADLEQSRSEPASVAQTAFARHLSPFPKGHPLHTNDPDEGIAELKAATRDGVQGFYQAFLGASAGELTLVGDFDPAELRGRIDALLGDWKSPSPYVRIPHPFFAAPAVDRTLELPDKANAFFMAGHSLKVQDTDPDYPALALGNQLLGGGALKSRLADRLRQKEGLSYTVASFLNASPLEPSGTFGAYAIGAPQNMPRLQAAFQEELALALKDGFTAEELRTAKDTWLQGQKVSLSQDRELAARLNNQLFLGRTMASQAELQDQIEALTGEQVLAALGRHLRPAGLSIFKAGTFAQAPAPPKP